MVDVGMTYGKKSDIITIPIISFSEIDYWRGMIDGDGSLGFTKEDEYIKNHSIEESIISLQRTNQSIKTRLWRLRNC